MIQIFFWSSNISNSYKPNAKFVCNLYTTIQEGEAQVAKVYESHTSRALVHNYFIACKYCVLPRYVAC